MSNDIKISFALIKGTNDLISVAKAYTKTDYECFECHDLLVKVAGDKRKHHFRHKNAPCNISRETCLHYGAKVYLKEMLEDGKQLSINVKTNVLEDTNLGKLLKHANINSFQIFDNKLYDNCCCIQQIEKIIKNSSFKGDIVSFQQDETIQMVWEIKVEHEIEPEKRKWLLENKIPFVELEPIENEEDDSFQFNLVSYGNINCFSQEHFSLLFNKEMNSIYGREIHSDPFIIQHFKLFLDNFEEIINKSKYSPGFKEAVCKNYLEYDCAVKTAKNFLFNNGIFEFTQTNYRNGWDKDKELKNVKYVEYNKFELNKSKDGYFYFKINDEHWVDNPTCFCGEFLAKLAKHIDVFGYSGKPGEITAISCNFFNGKFNNTSIKIPKDGDVPYFALNATNLSNIEFSGSERFKVSILNSVNNTVFNPDYEIANLLQVVRDLLEQLHNFCKIEFIVADSTKHNKRDVFGLRISGIYSVSKFNSEIIESVFKYVNKRLFAESKLNNKELGALFNSEMMYWVDEESGERIKFNPEDKIEIEFIKKEVKQI